MSSLPLTVSVLGFSWDTTNACSSPRWVCGLPECHLPSLPLILTGRKPSARGVPCWFSGEESTCQCRRPKRRSFDPWVKISWSRKCQPMPVFLPGKFYEQKSLAGYSPGGWTKNGTLLSTHAFHACMHTHTHTHTHPICLGKLFREDFPDTHTLTEFLFPMGLLKKPDYFISAECFKQDVSLNITTSHTDTWTQHLRSCLLHL